jgi:putative chitinase
MALSRVDRQAFFNAIRKWLRALNQTQVEGLEAIIGAMERDPWIPSGAVGVQTCAYLLATAYHETAHTWKPVRERGGAAYFIRMYGPKTRRGRALGNDTDEEAVAYSGVGLVQTTGENNMEAVEELLRDEYPEAVARFEARTGKRFDLTIGDDPDDRRDPDNLLDPELSYIALAAGTRHGLYGPPLSRYINPSRCDYVNARRSVNVLDKAEQIAGYARKIEAALRAGIEAATSSVATAAALPATEATAAGSPSGSQPAVVAPAVVAAVPVVPAEPVPGGAVTDPAEPANKQSLVTKIWKWIGAATGGGTIATLAMDKMTAVSTFSPEVQLFIVKGVFAAALLFGVIAVIIAAVDHLQTKYIKARPDLQNTK